MKIQNFSYGWTIRDNRRGGGGLGDNNSPKKSCKENLSEKKSCKQWHQKKVHAEPEKKSRRQVSWKKKIVHRQIFNPPPVISNSPPHSLRKTENVVPELSVSLVPSSVGENSCLFSSQLPEDSLKLEEVHQELDYTTIHP